MYFNITQDEDDYNESGGKKDNFALKEISYMEDFKCNLNCISYPHFHDEGHNMHDQEEEWIG